MFAIQTDLLVSHDPRVLLRTHNQIMRSLLRHQLLLHWKGRMPGHFEVAAVGLYHYKPRSAKYQRMKARVFHTTKPLVKTGQTRESITRTPPKITGTKDRATMRMRLRFAPSGHFRKGGTFKQIAARGGLQERIRELEAMTQNEREGMARNLKAAYSLAIERIPKSLQRQRRRGGG